MATFSPRIGKVELTILDYIFLFFIILLTLTCAILALGGPITLAPYIALGLILEGVVFIILLMAEAMKLSRTNREITVQIQLWTWSIFTLAVMMILVIVNFRNCRFSSGLAGLINLAIIAKNFWPETANNKVPGVLD